MKKYLLMLLLLVSASAADEILLMTENYPPLSYINEDNKVDGFCVDVVKEIQEAIGDESKIKVEIWSNALKMLEETKDSALFSMGRNPERAKKFTLVGTIGENQYMFFTKAGSSVEVKELEDAKKYKIGVYKGDICEQFLRDQGITNLIVAEQDHTNLTKLIKGEIDIWCVSNLTAYYIALQQHISPKEIDAIYTAFISNLYIGFNKTTDIKTIAKWTKGLQEIKEDGTYKKVLQKWAKKLLIDREEDKK